MKFFQYVTLSGSTLKIIAAISMLIDHMAIIFFPQVEFLRIIGRLAFPIYAFMIAEGCTYTKNKLRYFLSIFLLATACQLVYYFYSGSLYMSVLVTFSVAILVIYAMEYLKKLFFDKEKRLFKRTFAILAFIVIIFIVYILNEHLRIDYGFWGCLLPAFASIFRKNQINSKLLEKADKLKIHVLTFGIGLAILSFSKGSRQLYSLLAIPLLMLYSGKRGLKMKAFFYIFYPAHLAILECISML